MRRGRRARPLEMQSTVWPMQSKCDHYSATSGHNKQTPWKADALDALRGACVWRFGLAAAVSSMFRPSDTSKCSLSIEKLY